MSVKEYLATMLFGMIKGDSLTMSDKTMSDRYAKGRYVMPRIYCKDGFNISVQVHQGSYCGSENGIRQFGIDWKSVEWGFPSAPIDAKKYGADEQDTMDAVGAFVDINLIEDLIKQHGGIDLETTLRNEMEQKN